MLVTKTLAAAAVAVPAAVATAEILADPIAGSAGWVGTGLLGSVLWWLMFKHIPAKDKQLADFVAGRDAFVRELTKDFRETMYSSQLAWAAQDKERREDYKTSLATVADHFQKETELTGRLVRNELANLEDLAAGLRATMAELQAMLRQLKGGAPPP
jgi:hypothetical protein